jgi:beta(1,3)galactosyltransferase epsH
MTSCYINYFIIWEVIILGDTPVISVVMGVYNPDKEYLINSVNSILNQTFEDIEFIICDDGSNKNAYLFEELEKLDSRIIIIKNEKNMGLAYTLNNCIVHSQGKYIARQDADDISKKDRLEKQFNFLEKNLCYSFVGSNISLFDENGEYSVFKFPMCPQNRDFLFTSPFNHGSIMIRKKILEKNNMYRVSKETRRCEDYDLFIRLYIDNRLGFNIQEELYFFREDKDAKKRRKFIYRVDDFKIRKKYFKKLGIGVERYVYMIKPILVGLFPVEIIDFMKKIYYSHKI